MSHEPSTAARILARLSGRALIVSTAILVATAPGIAAADTTPATSSSPSSTSASPTSTTSASPSTTSSEAPTSAASPTTSGAPSSSTASRSAPSTPPAKGVELFHSMTPLAGPDTQNAKVAAGSRVATAAGVPAGMPLGVDVSSWQHTPKAATDINWPQVAASGQKFAIVKATEGDYYTNPFLTSDLNAAHAAGLVVGAYHFARPSISPITQADMFANAIKAMPYPHLPPVLDIEPTGYPEDSLGQAGLVSWTSSFLQRLAADAGATPMIYASPSFWNNNLGSTAFTQYPLWEAHYTTASAPAAMGGWPTYSLWQYTSSASVPGISGNVDQSVFNTATGANLSNLNGPVGSVDAATIAPDGTVSVSGWAFDPDTPTAADTVHVYVDSYGQAVSANESRPDIGAAFASVGDNHGFSATYQTGPGTHSVCVYAIDTSFATSHTFLGCRTVTLVPSLPIGSLDAAVIAGDGTLTTSGWTFDPDTPTTPVSVRVTVDGQSQTVSATTSRPDIGAAFPAAGSAHGYSATTSVGPGSHTVCVSFIDTYFGSLQATMGCRSATLVPALPVGTVEAARAAPDGTLAVSGWAFDPDTPTTSSTVHVYVDGIGHAITANGSRPDVGAVFPAAGSAHGFTFSTTVAPGAHSVCVYGIDTSFSYLHTTLGCRTVTR